MRWSSPHTSPCHPLPAMTALLCRTITTAWLGSLRRREQCSDESESGSVVFADRRAECDEDV